MNDEGGHAFPHEPDNNGMHYGMSLRDWFAGMAIAGLAGLKDGYHKMRKSVYLESNEYGQYDGIKTERLARDAYELADAMIAERAKVRIK